jgi:hypothetical protein
MPPRPWASEPILRDTDASADNAETSPLRFLYLPPSLTRDIALLLRSAFCRAIEVIRWRRQDPWHCPDGAGSSNTAVFGSLAYCRVVAAHLGACVVEPSPALPAELSSQWTQRAISLMRFEEASRISHPAFWKPAAGKAFPSGIYDCGADLPRQAPDALVLMQEIVEFESEHRSFVVRGEIRTHSWYKGEGGEAEALSFAEHFLLAEAEKLPPAFVLDTGYISGSGWAFVEANPLAASSIYDCDPDIVLRALPCGLAPFENDEFCGDRC